MKRNSEQLENVAESTLHETDSYRVPVPIERIAQRLNLSMEAGHLEDVAGMLIVRENAGAIGYNAAHWRVRQRFTISHEIAHYVLHARKSGKPQLFVDRYLRFRPDGDQSARNGRAEEEANLLGAALLMPKSVNRREIEQQNLNLDDEEAIRYLANRFQVSIAAIATRLWNLQILR